jgi:hypothetical protein
MSLFEKAKKSAPVKAAAKDTKTVIKITDPSFFGKVEKLQQLQDRMKSDKAKADMFADEIKDLGKEEWAKLYESTGKNPETVMLEQENENGDNSHVMFMVTDKYITINADRAEELQETYGEEIVEEKTVFSFDSDMVEKYGEILSRMIEECDEIAEKDREKIIKATTAYSVAKGTIDDFKKYGDVSEMIEMVKPVVALKNVEVIKG